MFSKVGNELASSNDTRFVLINLIKGDSKSNFLCILSSILKNVNNGKWLFLLGDFLLCNLLAKDPEVFESELDKLTNSELLEDFLYFGEIKAWDSLFLDKVTKIDKSNETDFLGVNFIKNSAQECLRLSN